LDGMIFKLYPNSLFEDGTGPGLGPRQKIIPPFAFLMARLLRYIHPHVSRYAQVDVPCRQTIIRRNRVELFLTVTLRARWRRVSAATRNRTSGRRCPPFFRIPFYFRVNVAAIQMNKPRIRSADRVKHRSEPGRILFRS